MRQSLLPFSPPWMGEEEIAEVADTLRSGWIGTGPKAKRFEQEFAAAVGAASTLAVNSCTAALHVSLAALGIGRGDAVMTTPMTFCSTVHVIEHVGARPVLVDVEPDTLNIDPENLRKALGSAPAGARVKAILPVHLYGHPCDLDPLLETAKEFGLAIIEDAAHALPARYKGRTIGSPAPSAAVPVLTCFSFYATKNLTTAEGGMLAGPPELVEEARVWSLHGMNRDAWKRYSAEGTWYYEVTRPGFKCNMADVQAAIGLQQLRKLPGFHARRAEIAGQYNAAFSRCEEFQVPAEREGADHAWHLYVLRLNLERMAITRNEFIEQLKARNISSSVHFIPVHLHPYYRDRYGYAPNDFPVAYREFHRIVSLPLFPKMSQQDVRDVIDAVLEIGRKYRVRTRPRAGSAAVCSPMANPAVR